jgi:hypothetical protein
MQQSPFGGDARSSGSQAIRRIKWKAKVHCSLHNSRSLVRLLCQITQVYFVTTNKINFSNTFPPYALTPKWTSVSGLPTILFINFISHWKLIRSVLQASNAAH